MSVQMAAWFGCGVLLAVPSFGITLAYFQRKYPMLAIEDYRADVCFAASLAALTIFAPPVFIVPLIKSGFAQYGMQFGKIRK